MSFSERYGDIFRTSAQVIGHGCNCRGVMGTGLALQMRQRWPDMYREYRELCWQGLFRPGGIMTYRISSGWLVNLATQYGYGRDRPYARLEWIDEAMDKVVAFCDQYKLTSLALPRIGCTNGGLQWKEVRPLLDQYGYLLDITVYSFDPAIK